MAISVRLLEVGAPIRYNYAGSLECAYGVVVALDFDKQEAGLAISAHGEEPELIVAHFNEFDTITV